MRQVTVVAIQVSQKFESLFNIWAFNRLKKIVERSSRQVKCHFGLRSAFGRKYTKGEFGKRFPMPLKELMQLLGSVNIGEYIPYLSWIDRFSGFDARVDKIAKELDDFLEKVIQEHLSAVKESGDAVKDEKSRENFVDILLKIYTDNMTGVTIDRDNLKGIILDILAGGTDTASATLEWAMSDSYGTLMS